MKAYVKVHKISKDIMVAICDEKVLDREFHKGKLKLHTNISFYKGKLIDVEDLEPFFASASILNIIGMDSVNKAIKCGYIDSTTVLEIGDTVHAQRIVV
ncbi:MAG: DUF424 domain-containing protein [Candidatus Methanofastidiosia archaeon]